MNNGMKPMTMRDFIKNFMVSGDDVLIPQQAKPPNAGKGRPSGNKPKDKQENKKGNKPEAKKENKEEKKPAAMPQNSGVPENESDGLEGMLANWTSQDIIKGFVFSEVLGKPKCRRGRW